ncbi:MAG: hypothetical protein ACON4H_16535 [Rubripirellula sp.]
MHFPKRVITTVLIAGLFANWCVQPTAFVSAEEVSRSGLTDSSGSEQRYESGLQPINGIGRTASGWVAGDIDLSASQGRGYSAYNVASVPTDASTSAASPSSPAAVSVLEGNTIAAPSLSLAAPANSPSVTLSPRNTFGAIGQSPNLPATPSSGPAVPSSGPSVNPLNNLAFGTVDNAGTPAGSNAWRPFWLRDGSRPVGSRFADWVRQFPPLNLNRSTSSSDSAASVWRNQVQSFFSTTDQQSLNQQALQREAQNLQQQAQALQQQAEALQQQAVSQSLDKPNDSGTDSTTAVSTRSSILGIGQGNGRNSLLSQFRGNLFPAEPYQAFRNPQQSAEGSGSPAGKVDANSAVSSDVQGGNSPQAYTAYQPPKQSCWNEFWGRWFGTGYRASSYRVPVTYYRPVITTDPTTGQQVVVQQPCTSFVTQQQLNPVRRFRSARPDATAPAWLDPNACPPGYSYVAAMPGVIYPGLGYTVTTNSTQGGLGSAGYVVTTGAMQPIAYPGVAVWNGAVVPASAVLVKPPVASNLQDNASLQNTTVYSSGETEVATRPLTSDDLLQSNGGESTLDDLSPVPAPRLESYRYTPSSSSEEASSSNRSSQRLFSAPTSIAQDARGLGMQANRGANYQWRLQDAADSTAMLRKTSPSTSAGLERESVRRDAEGRSEVGSDSSIQGSSSGPSLEELLRSENFVGAEPIAAPRDFQPSYRRSGSIEFQSMSYSDPNTANRMLPAKIARESSSKEVQQTSELTPISFTQPVREIPSRNQGTASSSSSSRFIRQPMSGR